MASLDSVYILTIHIIVCLIVVQGIYVPKTDTSSSVDIKPVCPETCQCSSQNTSNCVFRHDEYYAYALKPWKLTRLRIYGEETEDLPVWEEGLPSLHSVIYKQKDQGKSLSDEDIATVFVDVIELHINFVPFQQVSGSDFDSLVNLTVLNIANNGITTILKDSFSKLQKLKVLNLEGNRISSLPDNIFSELKNLKNLSLNGNDLHTLSFRTFEGLDMLENLYLQNNEILHIDRFVNSLGNLKLLDIRGNQLAYLLPESVEKLSSFGEVRLANNPFHCNCILDSLITAVQSHPTVFKSNLICDGPTPLKGQRIQDIDKDQLECNEAKVLSVTAPSYALYQEDITLNCLVTGTPPLGLYWITPWGDNFALPLTQHAFPEETEGALSDHEYHGINLILNSHVHVSNDGSLHIEKFRGYLSGNFTCVSVNPIGHSSNKSVKVQPYTKLRSMYLTSIIIGSICAAGALVIAIFIGAVRWFVSKCMHSEGCHCCCCRSDDIDAADKYKIEETQTVEITYSSADLCHTLDESEFDPDSSPPTVPVNSPQMRKSPEKCHTPAVDMSESDKNSLHIWGQLEEVRSRLRYGAERKMEKVRSHVRSFTDSGSLKIRNIKDASSLKIQSIKETGSHAASKVKKNVASGMEQVKYGVQSIKEFCGTGDMGTGTVSMISVCTDVDTKEQFKIVKSHTFV